MPPGPKTEVISIRRKPEGDLTGTLSVLEGPGVGRFYVLEAGVPFVMGRAEDCEASFPHSSVSRRHAEVLVTRVNERLRARLRDLGSTNGVRVNRRRTREQFLVAGDKIRLGRVLMRFEWLNAEEVAYQRRLAEEHQVALQDPLTGLLTRAFLDDRLPDLIDEAQGEGRDLSCLMVDIDRFKSVNDAYGHLVGDAVLRTVAGVISDTLRRSDFAVRYGGEEILCVLPELDGPGAAQLAEALRAAVQAATTEAEGHEVGVTVSIGVADHVPMEAQRQWIERADRALYDAKRAGRNQVVVAEDDLGVSYDTEPEDATSELKPTIDPSVWADDALED